jgi:hypothetical protein
MDPDRRGRRASASRRNARTMTTANPAGDYDAYARQYAANVAWREQGGVEVLP